MNINPKELRIGNLLKAVLTGEVIEVDWLVLKHIQDDGNIQSCHLPNGGGPVYEPIPLTEEWLRRCGFEKTDYKYEDGSTAPGFWLHPFLIRFIEEADAYMMEYFPYRQSHNCIPGKFLNVHQLQNLYFALTQKELEIKEVAS